MKQFCIFILCGLCLSVIGCKNNTPEDGVPYCPEGFPDFFVPPEGAAEIRYLSPETGKIVKGTYSLSYKVIEEYPAENAIEQIRSYLKSHDCVRVEWMPEDYSIYFIVGKGSDRKIIENKETTQEFREDLNAKMWPAEPEWQSPNPRADYADIVHSTWREEWITQDNDLVVICLQYLNPQETDEKIEQLFVTLTLFTPSSWQYPYVKRYKETYPEKFSKTKDPNDVN